MVSTTRKIAYPDATTVIALASEMSVSLKSITDQFESFSSAPKAKPISDDIRRIGDTSRLINLRALVIVCGETAELARRLETEEIKLGSAEIEALKGALAAIGRYVTAAATGKIGSGLLMYPAYAEVMRCMPGRNAMHRAELFLPINPVYGSNSPTYNEGKFIAEIARYHDEYRQAMMRYNQKKDLETVNAMRTTMVTMETKNPPANFRMFFSLAISFFDIATRAGGKISREDEAILARIDREVTRIVKGDMEVDEGVLSWFMYIVAQASQFSARIRTFQETYDLVRMIEEDLGGVVSEQTVTSARTALDNAQRAWEASMVKAGDVQAAKSASFALVAICNTIGDYALKTMAMSMGMLADGVATGGVPSNHETAVFGASVLIAIGERLDRIMQDPKGGRAIADFHKERVRAVVGGKKPSELANEMPAHGGHVQEILDQVIGSVQAAEQIVEQCLRDGVKESKIEEASKLFGNIASTLTFVNMNEGARACEMIAHSVVGVLRSTLEGNAAADADKGKMAESVMLLHRYISLMNVDVNQANVALARIDALLAPAQVEVVEEIAEDDGPFDVCMDDELGPIFFEEAKDVINNNVMPGLERLRANFNDEQTLLDVRRGFHTLKGSSRMVELNNLGLVGQHAEYALNIIRDDRNVKVNLDMIEWLSQAATLFVGAIETLEQGKPAKVNPEPFGKVYQHFADTKEFLLSVGDAPAPVAAPAVAEPVVQQTAPAPIENAAPVPESEPAVHIPETHPVIVPISVGTEEPEGEGLPAAELPAQEPVTEVTEEIKAAEEVQASIPAVAPESNPDVQVGSVTIPAVLYQAFVAEARKFYGQLEYAVHQVILGKRKSVDFEVMRMAHSLAGMGRTTGLAALTEIAGTIESWSSINQDRELNLNDEDKATLGDAIEALEAMIIGVEDCIEPMADAGLIDRLNAMIQRDEHKIVHGEAQGEVQESILRKLIETGCEVTDSGVVETVAAESVQQDQPILDVEPDAELPATEEASTVVMAEESTLVLPQQNVEEAAAPVAETEPVVLLDESIQTPIAETVGTDSTVSMGEALRGLEAAMETQPLVEEPIVVEAPVAETIEVTQKIEAVEQPAETVVNSDRAADAESVGMFPVVNEDIAPVIGGEKIAGAEEATDLAIPEIGDGGEAQAEEPAAETVADATVGELDIPPLEVTADEQSVVVEDIQSIEESLPPIVESVSIMPAIDADEELVADEPVLEAPAMLAIEDDMPPIMESVVTEAPPVESVVELDVKAEEVMPPVISESAFVTVNGGAIEEEAQVAPESELMFVAPPAQPAEEPRAEAVVSEETATVPVPGTVVLDDQQAIPPTVQTDIGTTTTTMSGMNDADRAARAQAKGAARNWLSIVSAKEDDVDEEMLEIFLVEADERFEEIDQALAGLAENIGDRKTAHALKRAVHTLKGSANTTGARKVGALFHYLEDLMDASQFITEDLCNVVQSGVDAAFAAIKAMKAGKSVEEAIAKLVQPVTKASDARADGEESVVIPESLGETNTPSTVGGQGGDSLTPSEDHMTDVPAVIAASSTVTAKAAAAKKEKVKVAASKKDEDENLLRVPAKTLDRMVKISGEINITRSRVGMNIDLAKVSLTGLASSLERMYGYLRHIELEAEKQMVAGHHRTGDAARDSKFDALQMDRFTRLQELTRRVAEAQNDILTQQGAAVSAVRDMEEAMAAQYVLVSDLSSDLDQIRQVRVSSIVPALKRVVRAACRDTNKKGEIFFDADVEIDRGILDKIVGSIEHILRNAVAHGIENPQEREKLGKDESGTIEFRAYQDGGEVVIEIRDDGRGLDTQKILAKAVERGLVKPGTRMTEEKVRELLFEPGFSTADSVTDIAGRGVGLDVVRSDISVMGGRIELQSTLGQGTTFILRVPATLTVISGAAVLTNGHMYVVPVSFINQLIRIGGKDLESAYKSRKLMVQETNGELVEYDFWGLWQMMGMAHWDGRALNRNSILLMRGDRVAVHIDDVRPATEFVFRPMGPQISTNSGLIGSTINSSGNASLVIDPGRVVRMLRQSAAQEQNKDVRDQVKNQKRDPMVLIVDDSLTVRKVTSRLLKKEGLRHAEAENGMQALERIQDERPDVILMDIEMPVMNGYEATQAIRATPETRDIPIIMITSRVGESHRQRAFELGVNEYLGKPYNDSDLMELIRKYTGESLKAAA